MTVGVYQELPYVISITNFFLFFTHCYHGDHSDGILTPYISLILFLYTCLPLPFLTMYDLMAAVGTSCLDVCGREKFEQMWWFGVLLTKLKVILGMYTFFPNIALTWFETFASSSTKSDHSSTANVSLILSLYTDGVWSGGSSRYI